MQKVKLKEPGLKGAGLKEPGLKEEGIVTMLTGAVQRDDGTIKLRSDLWSIYIGARSRDRVARLLDRLSSEESCCAGTICTDSTRAEEAARRLRVSELRDQVVHVPTAAEREHQALEDAWWAKRGLTNQRCAYPKWDFRLSGRLALEIWEVRASGGRRLCAWRDFAGSRLEDQLPEMISALERTRPAIGAGSSGQAAPAARGRDQTSV